VFEKLRRDLAGSALALLMVAAMTSVAYLMTHIFDLRRGSVIYLLPVLLAGWHLGRVPALVAAVAGVLGSGFLFYSPDFTYFAARPSEILNLVLFLAVALVTSHLANRMKRQTELAHQREIQMGELYAFSRRLSAADSAADIYRAIERHLATLVQRRVVLIETAPDGETGDTPEMAALPEPVRAAIAEVQRGSSPTATTDPTGNTWLVRRVSQQTPDFGVVAVDLGSASATATAEVRERIDGVLSDAAATLERLGVARALNEARMRAETELLREALIGSVSHELRTPLASILGAATVLSQAPAVVADSRLTALAEVVRDEAERLNNDIQNLLDATRISRDQVTPRLEWIEPSDIVNSALERRRRRLAGHPITLDMDSNLPFLYVDPVLVEQAFVQIVDNAAKYSPAGSTIAVAAKRNGHGVILSVSDSGTGLTAAESGRIGERFFRGPRHANTTSGSGLGLWIAKAFVAANGGRIQADSAGADQGATIAIHLPLAPHAAQPEADPDD
jgi:two-component system sensor histidine kinase KdpD